jgi:hypothetical protein
VIPRRPTNILKKARNGKTQRAPAILGHAVFLLAGMVLMFLLEGGGFSISGGRKAPAPRPPSAFRRAGSNGQPQPWGNLQYLPIALSRPEGYVTNLPPVPEATHWYFSHVTDNALFELLDAMELGGRVDTFLTDKSHWNRWRDGFEIIPSPEIVLDIPPDTRQKLYAVLAQTPENISQREPFRFRAGTVTDWLKDSDLLAENVELVRKLTYTNEGALCFADSATFAQLATPEQTTLLIKSLSRVPTFILKLQIEPDTKIEPLMRYWGNFVDGRDLRLFIQSLSRADSEVNVSFFLPSFARLRLYTYPRAEDPRRAEQNDTWTAMNFFSKKPDDRFLEPGYAEQILQSDYTRVPTKDKEYGDTVVFVGHGGKIFRMSTFLADDFVFTKRARGIFEPWLIVRIKELIAESSAERPFEVRVYRLHSATNAPQIRAGAAR